jgi:3-phosphoshikimate 1-carboxyvinyltransferase
MRVHAASRVLGRVEAPADKSISHRYAIIGAMARGRTRITNFSPSQDCQSSLSCVEQLGVTVRRDGATIEIDSPGWEALSQPAGALDAGNSGTTIRLLSAVLAARPMESVIAGDESLNRRPMKRVMTPLSLMGAKIEAREDQFPPLRVTGTALRGITYEMPVASAQVKSCVLLAGLMAQGATTVIENEPTRDHTERALPLFGAEVDRDGPRLTVRGPATLHAAEAVAPRDFSAAAYFILAALLLPGSEVELPCVGLNPTRAGLLTLLLESGADIRRCSFSELSHEPIADLTVRYSPKALDAFPAEIGGKWIPNLIDEIPALAVFGVKTKKGLVIRDAAELRKKESDRISAVVENLRRIGVSVEEKPDGMRIPPGQRIRGGQVKTYGDHRIAMAFAIAGLMAETPVEIDDPACAAVSFPDFFRKLEQVTR